MSFYPEPDSHIRNEIKEDLDLFNYATGVDLMKETCVDTSKLAKQVDLVNLKSDFDKLDIDKLIILLKGNAENVMLQK